MQSISMQADRTTPADEAKDMYLYFNIGKELYGVEIHYVLQIIGMQHINKMPDMPHGMKGFINLRGSMIPVYSLHARFGKAEPEYTERTCIIIIMIDEAPIGLIVDSIRDAVAIDPGNIQPLPNLGIEESCRYVSGIAQLQDEQTVLLLTRLSYVAN